MLSAAEASLLLRRTQPFTWRNLSATQRAPFEGEADGIPRFAVMKAFFKTLLVTLPLVIGLTLFNEYLDGRDYHGVFSMPLALPLLPGYLVYIITTGDIHGWRPGPIGVSGRIIVSGVANALFLTFVLARLLKRSRAKN